ncbi:hypothetical protein AgCh_039095 [Apium graveolens]
MNRTKLPIRKRLGDVPQFSRSIDAAVAEDDCIVFKLEKNMRMESGVPAVTVFGQKKPYADWVVGVGDGNVPVVAFVEGSEPCRIEIPPELHLDPEDDGKRVIIDTVYAELCDSPKNSDYYRDRAILTPLNEDVDLINKEVLKRFKGLIGSQDLRISGLRLSEDNIRRWISELKYRRTNS